MNSHRIYIIGASGTGKTTLAKAIAARLSIPHFDSDDYFHYPSDPPFQKQRSPDERANLLLSDLSRHSSWVLSGGAGTWQPAVAFEPTLVVFLYLTPEIRLSRLKLREENLYGSRLLPGGDMEKDHKEFMEWTKGYDDGSAVGTNTLPLHESYISGFPSRLCLNKPLTTDEQLTLVLKALMT
jgi:shikimate kinase